MKIALINSEYPSRGGHGGIATYTYTLANALSAAGNTVHVLARKGTRPDFLVPAVRFHTFSFQCPSRMRQILDMTMYNGTVQWEIGHARSVRDALLAIYKSDGLDVAEIPEYGGLAYACSRNLPFKVVVAFHTPTELVDSLNKSIVTKAHESWYRFERTALRGATAYRSPSFAIKKWVETHYHLSPQSVSVIRNPIYLPLYEKIKKSYPTDDDSIDLLFAGRLEHRKGMGFLSSIIKDILQIHPSVTMTFAGESDMHEGPNFRVRIENSLSDDERKRIWFLGPVNRGELAVLYCRSSIFLIPSLFENAPYSLLEAMASKLPVVGANAGGIPEIVTHQQNGQLFSLDKPETILKCIADYINDPYFSRSCAEQAFTDIKKNHAPERIAAQSADFYLSVK